MASSDVSSVDTVLAADVKRTELLAKEKVLAAKAESGDLSTQEELTKVPLRPPPEHHQRKPGQVTRV